MNLRKYPLLYDGRLAGIWRFSLCGIVLIGCLVRGVLVTREASHGPLDDPDNYLPLARSIAGGGGFALDGRLTAYRPPLYPLVLAPVAAIWGSGIGVRWGVGVLHVGFGAATILLTAVTARRWGLTPPRSLAAAAIVALDPVLVVQVRSVMTETLAALLTAATLAALSVSGRKGVLLGGCAFGLAALCRPSAWPCLAVAAACAILAKPGSTRERAIRGLALVVAAAATVFPWTIRNTLVFGEPIWTTTHGGYTLFLANNPVYYDEVVNGPPGAVWTGRKQWLWWDLVNRSMHGLSEPVADRAMRAEALRVIVARRGDFARASAARLGRFWGLAPAGAVYPRWTRLASALWTAPLWLALAIGFFRRELWRWPQIAAPAVLLGLTVVHAVYWTDQRMRAPAVPAIALIAAAATLPGRESGKDREKSHELGAEGA